MGGVARILDRAGERSALVSGGLAALSPETRTAIDALRQDATDWGREIYRVALNQQYSFSVSGGGNRASYYLSGGYYNEQGTTVGTGFERLNLTMKTDYDLLKNLRFGASLFVGQNRNDSYVSDTDVFANPSRYTRTVNPYFEARNPDGSYAYDPDMNTYQGNNDNVLDFNILEERANTDYMLRTRSMKTIFDLDYRPVRGLRLYTQFGLQVDNSATEKMASEETYFTRKYALYSVVDGRDLHAQGRRDPELERRYVAVHLEGPGRVFGLVRRASRGRPDGRSRDARDDQHLDPHQGFRLRPPHDDQRTDGLPGRRQRIESGQQPLLHAVSEVVLREPLPLLLPHRLVHLRQPLHALRLDALRRHEPLRRRSEVQVQPHVVDLRRLEHQPRTGAA